MKLQVVKRTISLNAFRAAKVVRAGKLEADLRLPLRVVFFGLQMFADRNGFFPWQPSDILAVLLPSEIDQAEAIFSALEKLELIARCGEGEGGPRLGKIPDWRAFQSPRAREKSRFGAANGRPQGGHGQPKAARGGHKEATGSHETEKSKDSEHLKKATEGQKIGTPLAVLDPVLRRKANSSLGDGGPGDGDHDRGQKTATREVYLQTKPKPRPPAGDDFEVHDALAGKSYVAGIAGRIPHELQTKFLQDYPTAHVEHVLAVMRSWLEADPKRDPGTHLGALALKFFKSNPVTAPESDEVPYKRVLVEVDALPPIDVRMNRRGDFRGPQ